MAKKVTAVVKLQLPGGKATPAPPVGPALAPHGINLMGFIKDFNEKSASQAGVILPVEVTIYEDRSYTYIIKTPPASFLIKRAAGVEKGSGVPNREKVGKITWSQVREIAQTKMPDLNANDLDAAASMIAGTARSMGIEVVRD